MPFSAKDFFALSLSLGLHVLVLAVLWLGLPNSPPKAAPKAAVVNAVFLDASRLQLAEQKRVTEARRVAAVAEAKRKAAEAKRKAEAEAARIAAEKARLEAEALARKRAEEKRVAEEEAARRRAEEKRKAEALAKQLEEQKAREAAKRKAAAEAKRKVEAKRKAAEAKRKAEAKQRAIVAQKKRQADAEQQFQQALAAEEAELQAQQAAAKQARLDEQDRLKYILRLGEHIRLNWSRPAGTDRDFSCRIRIQQLPGGQIRQVEMLESCGNSFLDASVESAVRKADPLPLPQNPRVFERTLNLVFVPE